MQEIFDTVVNHLREQGCKSTCGSLCMYRGDDGRKCAAGILIPDSDYSIDMERKAVENLWYFNKKYSIEELLLIANLQEIHDQEDVENWETCFENLAEVNNLRYEPPKSK